MLNKTESIRYKHDGVYTQLPKSYLESAKNGNFPKHCLYRVIRIKIFLSRIKSLTKNQKFKERR